MKHTLIALPLLFPIAFGQQVQIDSSTITASSEQTVAAGGDFGPDNTLDGETLEGWQDGDPADPDGLRPDGHQGNQWTTNADLSATITYDLGSSYDLSKITILNTSNSAWNDRETDNFTIAFSSDGGATYGAESASLSLQNYTLGSQDFLVDEVGVTHVQLNVTNDPNLNVSEQGPFEAPADRAVGLNEVSFFTGTDIDSDGDMLPDNWELDNFADLSQTADGDIDTPNPDGLSNLEEFMAGTDPLNPDSDGDSLSDGDEVNVHNSNPLIEDSDGDSLKDGDEVNIHMSRPDLLDTDGDQLSDDLEVIHLMTDPTVATPRIGLVPPFEITVDAGSRVDRQFDAQNLVDDKTLEGFRRTGDPGPPVRLAEHQNNHWTSSEGTLTETVTFDLGGTYDLTEIEVLNSSNSNWNDRETDTFTIATSIDNGTTFTDPSAPITLQDYLDGFQAVPLAAPGVTHVQLVVTNDPAAGTNTDDSPDRGVGLNEVRFYGGRVSTTPGTPSTLSISSLTYVAGATSAELTWNSVAGENYLVEFSDDLGQVQWDEAPDGESVLATGPVTTFTVEYDPAEPVKKRFFRVTRL